MTYSSSAHAKAIELTRLAFEMTAAAGSGHPTSAASLAHLVTVLLYDRMRFDPAVPDAPDADRLVLSGGHACPIVYAAAADLGIAVGRAPRRRPMTRDDLDRLRTLDGALDGHPNPIEGFPFFPAATGSLGQGLSIAAGLAIAGRLDGVERRVYCVVGDGESREGQVWEAVDMIAERGLTDVCPIFNCNGFGQTDAVSTQQTWTRLANKLRAFGLDVEVVDGHDPLALRDALRAQDERGSAAGRAPLALVMRTTKGWGVRSMQHDNPHGVVPSEDGLAGVLRELEETAQRLRVGSGDPMPGPTPRAAAPAAGVEIPRSRREVPRTLDDALREAGRADWLDAPGMATRDAFGVALAAVGGADPDLVVLDGDVSDSTRAGCFLDDPELAARFVQCGIAEQNMMSCAVGLAAGGKKPFVTTFGKFLSRAYDQLEMGLISGRAIRLVGSHVGVGPAADGPSQMALSDVAFFRGLAGALRDRDRPSLHVLNPCDARAAYALTISAARHDGSSYLRTMRPATPWLGDADHEFAVGGFRVLEEGPDLIVAAWGMMVHEARRACRMLAEHGIRPTLVDMYSVPFTPGAFAGLVATRDVPVLTVEDNYGGALGSEVADVLAAIGERRPLHQMFVRAVPKSARTPGALLEHLGLSATDIAQRAEQLLRTAQ